MKLVKFWSILSLALVLGLLIALVPAAPASAAVGNITLSAASGKVGSTLMVTGTGFTAGGNYTVFFDAAAITNGPMVGTGFTAAFNVPAGPAGAKNVTVTTAPAGDTSNTPTFTITPDITLSNPTVQPGTPITVTGSGFGANLVATINIDSVYMTAVPTNPTTGSFSATVNVPQGSSGTHTVSAVDTLANLASATYKIVPSVTISPNNVTGGAQATLSGNSFATNSTVTVSIDGMTITTGSTTSTGSFSMSLTIPQGAGGYHTVNVVDSGGNTGVITYNITKSLSVNPSAATVGAQVTINGSAFAASSSVALTLDGASLTSLTSSINGSFTYSLTIPQNTGGSHTLTATDAMGNTTSTTFTINPSVTVSPSSFTGGSQITINGNGFAPSSIMAFLLDNSPVSSNSVITNNQGSFTTPFAIPSVAGGAHTLQIKDSSNSTVNLNFGVISSMTINPQSGAPGATLQVSGSGFMAKQSITINYDGKPVATSPPVIQTEATGKFIASFTVPAGSGGAHSVTVTDGSNTTTASFNVLSSANLSLTKASPGTNVTISGNSFIAGSAIEVKYDNTTVIATATVDANGSFSVTFDIPAGSVGAHSISVSDGTKSIPLTLSIVPRVVLTPDFGDIGSTTKISGSGFAPNSLVTISYDDKEVIGQKVSTDAAGSFTNTITVPKSTGGSHNIKVIDAQKNEARAAFTMDNTAPATPRLLSPEDGARADIMGDDRHTFKWSGVTDPSSVTYILQVDTSTDFTQPILIKTDLTGTQYTLTATEALPRGDYYWRVAAIDGASNQSAWSAPQLLQASLISFTLLIILIIIAAVVVAALLAYFLAIRPRLAKKKAAQVPVVEAPEIITGQWQAISAPTDSSSEVRALPFRLALPESPKPGTTLSAEDQARLKVVLDFARSLPLLSPDNNTDWLVALAETGTGTGVPETSIYEQLLKGELQLHYEPSWIHHPIYQDLTTLLEGQPVLQDLNAFVEGVDRCADEAIALLQEIYLGTQTENPPSDFFQKGGREFVSTIYSDAIGWFLGKSLREPTQRDYAIKPDDTAGGTFAVWLSDESSASSTSPIFRASDEKEAQQLQALHLKLRREQRNSNHAKRVGELITQLEVRRNRLLSILSQFGFIKQ